MRLHYFFFSNRDVLRVVTNIGGNRLNQAGITQELITISKITLEHAA